MRPTEMGSKSVQTCRHALQSRWMLLVLLVPLVVLLFAAAVLIWPINYAEGPYRRDPYRKYATPSALAPLLKGDSNAGESVYLNEIRLVPGAKDNEFIARGASGNAMLVIATGQAAPLPKTPAIVDIQGVIRTLPAVSTLKHDWKLNKKQLQAVSGEQYYIAAQHIHIDSRATTQN